MSNIDMLGIIEMSDEDMESLAGGHGFKPYHGDCKPKPYPCYKIIPCKSYGGGYKGGGYQDGGYPPVVYYGGGYQGGGYQGGGYPWG